MEMELLSSRAMEFNGMEDDNSDTVYRYAFVIWNISKVKITKLRLFLSIDLYLAIFLSICLPIFLSACLSIYLFIYSAIYLSFYLCFYLSIYLSTYLSIYISIFFLSMNLINYASIQLYF